jgi:hypothetical protein
MSILKKIPVSYLGELHDIRLVNFTVDPGEIAPHVPAPLKMRLFNGRALISMVNVELKKMHPAFLPGALNFSYRHVAFRLAIDDSERNGGACKGIYFLRSFTDKPLVAFGGSLLTDYQLGTAHIYNLDRMLELRQGDKYFNYALDLNAVADYGKEQRDTIGSLDRAYAVRDGEVHMVRILREQWPIRPVGCYLLETNFFRSAKFVSAFVVDEVIRYEWMSPKALKTSFSH